jgi:hypothetical protein
MTVTTILAGQTEPVSGTYDGYDELQVLDTGSVWPARIVVTVIGVGLRGFPRRLEPAAPRLK